MLVSAIHQHESARGTHMSPPSWTSLPPSTISHPSRLLQSARLELPAAYSKFPPAIYLFGWAGSSLQHTWSLIFSCGMWDPIPRAGIESGPPALGAWSLSHWITREVRVQLLKKPPRCPPSGCTTLHSHQQWRGVSVASQSQQCLLSSVIWFGHSNTCAVESHYCFNE